MSEFFRTFENTAQTHPTALAIVEGETRWTYRDMLEQVNWTAAGLKAKGVQPGEHVGMILHNQKEFLVTFLALRKLGAIVVPINIQILPQDICYVVQHAELKRAVIDESLYTNFSQLPLQFFIVGKAQDSHQTFEQLQEQGKAAGDVPLIPSSESELAFLLYTSGTTGHPKGVMLSENNILSNIEGFRERIHFSEQDRIVLALPLYHAFGLIIALAGLFLGASVNLIPKFHPRSILEAMVQERGTILPLVPTLFTILLEMIQRKGGITFPDLRFCVSGGAALPPALLKRIEEVFKAPVLEGYGLTETSPVLTVNSPEVGSVPGSVGKPLYNVQIKIVDDEGNCLPQGEVGEVLAKGGNIMLGYYKQDEETRKVLDADGWFRTGDLGHFDPEGRLYISGGRKKELIIKAGENISPVTIEQVLYQHPAIREAAVIGIPDERLGEEIMACVSLKEGESVTEQEIMRYSREHLSTLLIPGVVKIMEELPKSATGKILKKILKEQFSKPIGANSK